MKYVTCIDKIRVIWSETVYDRYICTTTLEHIQESEVKLITLARYVWLHFTIILLVSVLLGTYEWWLVA